MASLLTASCLLPTAFCPPASAQVGPTPERPPNADARQEFPYWSLPVVAPVVATSRWLEGDLAYDAAKGILHAVTGTTTTPSFGFQVFYFNSAPETRTSRGFSTPFLVDSNALKPQIAVDPAGIVHVVWEELVSSTFPPTPSGIRYRQRHPIAGWGPVASVVDGETIDISTNDCNRRRVSSCHVPDIAVDRDGGVHIVFINDVSEYNLGGNCPTPLTTQHLKYAINLGAPETVASRSSPDSFFTFRPRLAIDHRPAQGILVPHVAFSDTAVHHSERGAAGWTEDTIAPGGNPDLWVDGAGGVHVCYQAPGGGGLAYSMRAGGGFGASETVFPSAVGESRIVVDSRLHPHVCALSGTSFLYARRNDLGEWQKGRSFPRISGVGTLDLAIAPNDQIVEMDAVFSSGATNILFSRISDPDLGEQDAFATFDVGPNASANLANGNLFFTAPLFSSRGVGISTNFSLIYNSLSFEPSLVSQGWQHNYDIVLSTRGFVSIGSIIGGYTVRFGDGRAVEFDSSGIALARYGHFSKIAQNAGSHNGPYSNIPFLLTGKFGLEFHFDANGRLIRLVDTNANVLTLTQQEQGASVDGNPIVRLSAIADSAGRTSTLNYDSNGRLQNVTDPAGRGYTLTYTPDPLRPVLSSVKFDATATMTYSGDTWGFSYYTMNDPMQGFRANLLAQVRTPRGQAAISQYGTDFFYYQDNRFARSFDPAADHVAEPPSFAVSNFRASRGVTYANPVPGTLAGDDEAWTAAFTDRRGFITTVHYQYFRSIATKIVDPLLKKIVRAFDPDFRNVLSIRDKRGNSTGFAYATTTGFVKDNVETITRPGAAAIVYTYTAASNDPNKNLNRVGSVRDGRGNITSYEYFPETGNLKTIAYPAAGEPAGPCTQDYAYDGRGRILSLKSPAGNFTTYEYTPEGGIDVGLATKINRPNLKPMKMEYDIMGVMRKQFMPEQPTKPTQLMTDGRDRVVDGFDPINAQGHVDLDPNGNPTASKDPLQNIDPMRGKTSTDYDNLDRPSKSTNAENNFAETKYDPNGNVRVTVDLNGNVARYAYDALNRPVRAERLHMGAPALTMSYQYDESSNRTGEVQEGGGAGTKTTTHVFDARNREVRAIHEGTAEGIQIDIVRYDENDNTILTMRRAVVAGDPSDPNSFPGSFVMGVAFTRDARNRVTEQTELLLDPGSDPMQPPTVVGTKTSNVYDCDGNALSVTEGSGSATSPSSSTCQKTTAFAYDGTNRLIHTTGQSTTSGPMEIGYTYDDNGNPKSLRVDDPNGSGMTTAHSFVHNDRNELAQAVDAQGNAVVREYDLNGNLIRVTDRGNCKVGYVYSSLNRRIETRVAKQPGVDPLTAADSAVIRTRYQYDNAGNLIALIDPRSLQYDFVYDGLNRLIEMDYPAIGGQPRNKETYAYDAFGNLLSLTDKNGKFAEFAYDGRNRLITETHYTDSSKSTVIVQITRTYDAANNLTSIEDGATKIVHAYTGPGELVDGIPQPINALKQVDWSIKNGGVFTPFKSIAYAYDECGKRVKTTEPEGAVVRYAYDEAFRLRGITRQAPGDIERSFVQYAYDKGGRRRSAAYGNGTTMYFGYDIWEQLTRLQLAGNGSGKILSSFQYEYDARGMRTKAILDHLGTVFTYGYDCPSRLTSEACTGTAATPPPFTNSFASQPGGNESGFSNQACAVPGAPFGSVPAYTASYSYDDSGNRLTKADSRLGTFGYSYDEENRLTTETFDHPPAEGTVDETFTYTYDKNGNLLARDSGGGVVRTHSYDYADRLKSFVKESGATVTTSFTYTYAPTGERLLKTDQLAGSTTAFMYDGADVVADYFVPAMNTYSLSKSYVQGPGVDSKFAEIDAFGATLFYNNDALGTVHQIVNVPPAGQDPQVLSTQLTTAWGEDVLQPSQVTRYHFNGRERDEENDLVYYRNRHYSSSLGRFIQPDPILTNRATEHYAYVANNPVMNKDPMGLSVTADDWANFGRLKNVLDYTRASCDSKDFHSHYRSLLSAGRALIARQSWYDWGGQGDADHFYSQILKIPDKRPASAEDDLADMTALQQGGEALKDQMRALETQIAGVHVLVGAGAAAATVLVPIGGYYLAVEIGTTAVTVGGVAAAADVGTAAAAMYVTIKADSILERRLRTETAVDPEDIPKIMALVRLTEMFIAIQVGKAGSKLEPRPSSTLDDLTAAAARAHSTVGAGKGGVHGTKVHTAFEAEVKGLGNKNLSTEKSYLGGRVVPRGTSGSVRLDVVEGPLEQPTAIYDLKTGGAKLTPERIQQIQSNVPGGANVPVIEVR